MTTPKQLAGRTIADILEDLTSESAVSSWVDDITSNYEYHWCPVGARPDDPVERWDREENVGQIRAEEHVDAVIAERVTNALDAVLELEAQRHGWTDRMSAHELVSEAFEIEEGDLRKVDFNNPVYQNLADRVKASLRNPSDAQTATLDIRDHGIGLTADEIGRSILSLNAGRKQNKFYLIGAFGQGGSASLSFSPYTIILSRKTDSSSDVAVTVVTRRDRDGYKHGRWEYLVSKDKRPFVLSCDRDVFDHGTLVRQVNMDLGRDNTRPVTSSSGLTLYNKAQQHLFDTPLPFTVDDQREDSGGTVPLRCGGVPRQLEDAPIVESSSSDIRQSFGDGSIRIQWWVFRPSNPDERDHLLDYTTSYTEPVVLTNEGQKVGSFKKGFVTGRNQLHFPFLNRHLLVHVDLSPVPWDDKRELISGRRGDIITSHRHESSYRRLRRLVRETLREDDTLRRIHRQRRDDLTQAQSTFDDDFLESLGQEVAEDLREEFQTRDEGMDFPMPPDGTRDEPIPAHPTDRPVLLEIVSDPPIEVYPDKNFSVSVDTDASDRCCDDHLEIETPANVSLRQVGMTENDGGRKRIYFHADDDVEFGPLGDIRMAFEFDDISLSDRVPVKAVDPLAFEEEEDADDNEESDPPTPSVPDVSPMPVNKESPQWDEFGFDDSVPARIRDDGGVLYCFVSLEHEAYQQAIRTITSDNTSRRRVEGYVCAMREYFFRHMVRSGVRAYLTLEQGDESWDESDLDRILNEVVSSQCTTIRNHFRDLTPDSKLETFSSLDLAETMREMNEAEDLEVHGSELSRGVRQIDHGSIDLGFY